MLRGLQTDGRQLPGRNLLIIHADFRVWPDTFAVDVAAHARHRRRRSEVQQQQALEREILLTLDSASDEPTHPLPPLPASPATTPRRQASVRRRGLSLRLDTTPPATSAVESIMARKRPVARNKHRLPTPPSSDDEFTSAPLQVRKVEQQKKDADSPTLGRLEWLRPMRGGGDGSGKPMISPVAMAGEYHDSTGEEGARGRTPGSDGRVSKARSDGRASKASNESVISPASSMSIIAPWTDAEPGARDQQPYLPTRDDAAECRPGEKAWNAEVFDGM